MLDELLAIIHMDGGQYTLLTGYAVSLEDAATRVIAIRKEMTRLQNQLRK